MKENFYITQDGELKRKENTIYFVNENTRRAIPVDRINTIYAHGSLSMSSGVILYLAKKGIPVHFFDYYGWYKATLYPRETLVSGDMVVRQAAHYLDKKKRLCLAQKFVEGAAGNILRNLKYQSRRTEGLDSHIQTIDTLAADIPGCASIPPLMRQEGKIRETYYTALDSIFPEDFQMGTRTRQPPNNRMNALVSFGNSLVYTTVLSEIYNTQLHPAISFLHQPFERRFSLSLDVSEIFKPILADRIILKLVNKGMLSEGDFEGELGDLLLSDRGKKTFLREWDSRLKTTIKHRGLNRKVSYRRLIRLELYKLAKHCLGEKKYSPLIMWW
ncbi:MAG: type I-B CRISPR-associated endonuclease Cas1b [Candidatus Thermoplasmatota archaeon]|nr:type I-B CRISPR-associated endonuclease Cas1b [Candidatus Thermoplasmatota archaeon]